MTLQERVKERVTKTLLQILMDERVRLKGIVFLVELLKQPQTQDAVVILLKNVLHDRRFIYHSNLWATNLLSWSVGTEDVVTGTQKLFEKILRKDEIVEETVDMLKYVTQRKESQDIISAYYQEVFKRQDIKNAVTELLAEGAYQGLADPKTVAVFAQFVMKVVNTDQVRTGVMETFVYRPFRNLIWFWYPKNN